MTGIRFSTLLAATALLSTGAFAQMDRTVAIWPWTFDGGTQTSRDTAIETVRRIAEKQGFIILPQEGMRHRWEEMEGSKYGPPFPAVPELGRYAGDVKARFLFYGHVHWHTRSIWVGTGPKTISTAFVEASVLDTKTGRVVMSGKGEGRSDERENTLKDVVDVLITPLVTVVSGGPATPREQRAVQIAMNRAVRPWVHAYKW